VDNVEDVMKLGDEVEVKVIEIDREGRVRFSRKELLPKPEGYEERPRGPRDGGGGGGGGGDRGGRGGDRDRGGRGGGRDRDRGRRGGGGNRPPPRGNVA